MWSAAVLTLSPCCSPGNGHRGEEAVNLLSTENSSIRIRNKRELSVFLKIPLCIFLTLCDMQKVGDIVCFTLWLKIYLNIKANHCKIDMENIK
jgi:hypothetical protein